MFDFESGTVSFYFSFIFVLLEESHLIVLWCAGGRGGIACSDKYRDMSSRLGANDRG
jgi:hypothetical protein